MPGHRVFSFLSVFVFRLVREKGFGINGSAAVMAAYPLLSLQPKAQAWKPRSSSAFLLTQNLITAHRLYSEVNHTSCNEAVVGNCDSFFVEYNLRLMTTVISLVSPLCSFKVISRILCFSQSNVADKRRSIRDRDFLVLRLLATRLAGVSLPLNVYHSPISDYFRTHQRHQTQLEEELENKEGSSRPLSTSFENSAMISCEETDVSSGLQVVAKLHGEASMEGGSQRG